MGIGWIVAHARDLSAQADLAQRVSVSGQTINATEKGTFDPSLPLAFRVARLFDLRIEELFIDEELHSPSLPSLEHGMRRRPRPSARGTGSQEG